MTTLVLSVSLLVSYNLWRTADRNAEQALLRTFDFGVHEVTGGIRQRLSIYEQVLRATVGLFAATDNVTRERFRVFVETLNLGQRYPGIQGIGFAAVVPPAAKDAHEVAVRKEGFPEYAIMPPGNREMYTTILYLEPFSGRNLRAFGYDMYSQPVRRAAMERARDSGETAVSGKVRLVQEAHEEVQAGFLMYLPVYRNGTSTDSVEERRGNLLGWVYAPFRAGDFMGSLLDEQDQDIDVEIYDGGAISDAAKMYDADPRFSAIAPERRIASVNRVLAAGRDWTVATAALPAFETRLRSDRPLLVLQAGISISLMVALLTWLFLDDRARALQAAHQAMQLALYDALTGLPNRKLLDERLAQALAKARRSDSHVALMFIDLDKFKPVNDNYGHAYGDLLLKEVAKRLQYCMRESDTASRLGGDEFVALLPEVESRNAAAAVAAKILEHLTRSYEIAGHTFDISASIGVAVYPEHGADAKTLVKSADLAMYDAKNSGRGTIRLAQTATAAQG